MAHDASRLAKPIDQPIGLAANRKRKLVQVIVLGAMIGSRVLATILSLAAPVAAQELMRLPPVLHEPGAGEAVAHLHQRINQLEFQLANLPDTLAGPTTPALESGLTSNEPQTSPTQAVGSADSDSQPDARIHVGGYVKLDLIHDFNAIGSTDAFNPLTIPTDGRPGQNTRFHARQTRLNLEYSPPEDREDLRLFIEGDFFGTGDAFRLRHAFVQRGHLLAGQTWSTFMDESILPRTLDFESARSVILDRRGMLRWSQPVIDDLTLSVALEDPQTTLDLDAAPAGNAETAAPDLIGRLRNETDWGHLQVAGVVRLLRFRSMTGATDDAIGWGVNITGRVQPREFDSVLFQIASGEGIESYRQGVDAAVDAAGGLSVLPVIAWVVGYEIDWNDRASSSLVYSSGSVTNPSFRAVSVAKSGEYIAANLILEPVPRFSWGIEYLYGSRTEQNDARGDAHRLQFSVRYDLP